MLMMFSYCLCFCLSLQKGNKDIVRIWVLFLISYTESKKREIAYLSYFGIVKVRVAAAAVVLREALMLF
jgi:hypothetical protein